MRPRSAEAGASPTRSSFRSAHTYSTARDRARATRQPKPEESFSATQGFQSRNARPTIVDQHSPGRGRRFVSPSGSAPLQQSCKRLRVGCGRSGRDHHFCTAQKWEVELEACNVERQGCHCNENIARRQSRLVQHRQKEIHQRPVVDLDALRSTSRSRRVKMTYASASASQGASPRIARFTDEISARSRSTQTARADGERDAQAGGPGSEQGDSQRRQA